MANNSSGNTFTVRQFAVILTLIFLVIGAGGILHTKADKDEVVRVEARVEKKINGVQKELKEDIKDLKFAQNQMNEKQEEMFKLLTEINVKVK